MRNLELDELYKMAEGSRIITTAYTRLLKSNSNVKVDKMRSVFGALNRHLYNFGYSIT